MSEDYRIIDRLNSYGRATKNRKRVKKCEKTNRNLERRIESVAGLNG